MSDRRRRTSKSRFSKRRSETNKKNSEIKKEKENEKEKEKEKEKDKKERERSRDREIKEIKSMNPTGDISEHKLIIYPKAETRTKNKGKEKETEKVLNNILLSSQSSSLNASQKDISNQSPTIKINKEKLLKLLKCPLCKGFYRTPYTINECMHTFCRSCIYKYFGSSIQRETCPVCKTKIGGRPMDSLIFDNYLDSLLNILFPQFEELDKENIKLLYKTFRDIGNPLQGDEEEAKMKMPNIKIFINPENIKENKFTGVFLLQKNFNIETMKKLIKERTGKIIDIDNIGVKFKDKELDNNLSLEDIDIQLGLDQDKNIFYYSFKKKGKE